jgi:hypothetical protein
MCSRLKPCGNGTRGHWNFAARAFS